MRYPLDRLHEEVAFVAATLGWSHDEILAMTHEERARWVRESIRLNQARQQRRQGTQTST